MAGVIMVDCEMKGGLGYYGRIALRCKVAGVVTEHCEIKGGWGYYGRLCVR